MASKIQYVRSSFNCRVADPDPNPDTDPPDPDPPDPRVFGPPGSKSRSISQRYGSGSGSDLDPSNIKQNSKKTIDFSCLVTSFYRILRKYDVTTS